MPRYETYDVLDDNQLTAFLSREANRLGIRQLDQDRLFASIAAFLKSVDVVENELLDPAAMPDPFGSVLRAYYETLDRYRLLTYGQQVVRAVRELERPELAAEIHARLRHLIVDEYQDVNPAQETADRAADRPAGGPVRRRRRPAGHLPVARLGCLQHRTFPDRYSPVETFEITINRRSRPQIIEIANQFARTIPERIDKTMAPHRPPSGGAGPEVVVWSAPTEVEEAGWIANMILDLADKGVRYRDIAVLVRSRAAYPRLVEQFATFGIPVQPGGRSGLFDQPEAVAPRPHVRLAERHRMAGPLRSRTADHREGAVRRVSAGLRAARSRPGTGWRGSCAQWKAAVPRTDRPANLIGRVLRAARRAERPVLGPL